MDKDTIREIKRKRTEQLIDATNKMIKTGILDLESSFLDANIVSEVVDFYTRELKTTKEWYNITDKVNYAKIAGIMASGIMLYRPWIPRDTNQAHKIKTKGNAILAIYQGLILLSIEDHDFINRFIASSKFMYWFDIFQYILRKRHHNADMLIMVFETIRNCSI